MYRRAVQRFEKCPVCGREIRLARHGFFRRHVYPKGVVCSGSWQRPTSFAADTRHALDGGRVSDNQGAG